MNSLTFGFMDSSRASEINAKLFINSRNIAIKSHRNEKICNMVSFEDDSIEESHDILCQDLGHRVGYLRDKYYEVLSKEKIPIRLPDIQSFYLYAFALGINQTSVYLLDPEDLSIPRDVPSEEILDRRFQIRGPEWVCNTVNIEMPYVENVFCDFQDLILKPIGESKPIDHRLLADAIAVSFLWSYFGGYQWINEAINEICDSFSKYYSSRTHPEDAVYQVKRSLQLITSSEMTRILTFNKAES